jgi:succinate dehydrogenase / fumarate reductase, flavoprotein subunit
LLDFRRFGGTLYNRTAFAGATTGQQLLYALDEQVRRYESEGKVKKYEHWEFLSAVLDGNRVCRGICAMDLAQHGSANFPGRRHHHRHRRQRRYLRQVDQLCGLHGIGAVRALSAGLLLRERRIHSGASHLHSGGRQAAADVGIGARRGRTRVGSEDPGDKRDPKTIPQNERWYFLEEWYPKYGNLVPRDIATRAIFKVVYEHNLGIDGKPMVYLDLTHIDRKILDRKLEGILEIYEKFVGDDPRDTPMKIFPGMHYTMGGLWVDFKQALIFPASIAAGECEYQYHGANRLGANSLVSCIYGGGIAGPNAVKYARGLQALPDGNGCFDAEKKKQEESNSLLMNNAGTENPFRLWKELGELMTKDCTVIRYNKNLQQTDANLVELLERFRKVNLSDRTQWANTSVVFTRQLYNMLQLARVIAQGARMRDESRGAHYKPDFPERDDKNFLKTTKAYFAPDADEPKFEFEPVDVSLIPPRPRKYDAAK